MSLIAAAALSAGVKNLFDYNRSSYKFDQHQKLEREVLRLEMQLRRFELFREDIRDLVKLTVDRMDIYHLVGALFLQFCIVILTKGRIQAAAPPFLLSLFLLTAACAFIYLLLAVWMSVHASIASHSFGVKLLTRFIRLPIPSVKQIDALNFKLKDFEKQGVGDILRMPFQSTSAENTNQDQADKDLADAAQRRFQQEAEDMQSALDRTVEDDDAAGALGTGMSAQQAAVEAAVASIADEEDVARAAAAAARSRRGELGAKFQRVSFSEDVALLPDRDVDPILAGDNLLSGSAGSAPERHVQLFRLLQAKWQCYDAYCRVCMSLGVNQMLQVLSYYAIAHTLVENHSPSTGLTLVFGFQCATVALGVFDLAGLKRREIVAVQVIGVLPCILSAIGMAHGTRNKRGELDPNEPYSLSPLSFLLTACWLELWLLISSPSKDRTRLPRRFRQVLFLDVFGDACDDPTEKEEEQVREGLCPPIIDETNEDIENEARAAEAVAEEALGRAGHQLALVQNGLRRWRAAPRWALKEPQKRQIDALNTLVTTWATMLEGECHKWPFRVSKPVIDLNLTPWNELSAEERVLDPFRGFLLGPFEHDGTQDGFFYDLDLQRTLFPDAMTLKKEHEEIKILTLDALAGLVERLEAEARRSMEARIVRDLKVETRRQRVERVRASPALSAAASFPNLVAMVDSTEPVPELPLEEEPDEDDESPEDVSGDRDRLYRRGPGGASGTNGFEGGVSQRRVRRQRSRLGTWQARWKERRRRRRQERDEQRRAAAADPAYNAVAGKDAMHFVPERLPWHILSTLTRVLQACWLWAFIMAALKEMDVFHHDFGLGNTEGVISEDAMENTLLRRLCFGEQISFEALSWDSNVTESMLRSSEIICPAGSSLLVASPFALYSMTPQEYPLESPSFSEDPSPSSPSLTSSSSSPSLMQRMRPQALEELQRLRLSTGSALACAQSNNASTLHESECLLAAPRKSKICVWPLHEVIRNSKHVCWSRQGVAWHNLTAATVRCETLGSLLPAASSMWCLLLAGWDGESSFNMAVHQLPHGPGLPPVQHAAGEVLLPVLSIPASILNSQPHGFLWGSTRSGEDPSVSKNIRLDALHLEASPQPRLWALWTTGDLEVWSLGSKVGHRQLASWLPAWPRGEPMSIAVCQGPDADKEVSIFALLRVDPKSQSSTSAAASSHSPFSLLTAANEEHDHLPASRDASYQLWRARLPARFQSSNAV
mmetsp:Transcript_41050/g.88568  ORF Transcript_41050/g.88568 Transcript_41050/m.88568 type:complete len:1230 (+) Transcript_41050:94-3783(+)